jgi:hypothetical protein
MKAEMNAKELAGRMVLTLRVKRLTEWEIRIRIAIWLIKLASRIMWIKLEIEREEEEEGERKRASANGPWQRI